MVSLLFPQSHQQEPTDAGVVLYVDINQVPDAGKLPPLSSRPLRGQQDPGPKAAALGTQVAWEEAESP